MSVQTDLDRRIVSTTATSTPGPPAQPIPPGQPMPPTGPLPHPPYGRRRGGRGRVAGVFVVSIMLTAALSSLGTLAWMRGPGSPEWRQVFREDFGTDVAIGHFPGTAYGSVFSVYPDGWADTSGRGRYAPSTVLSVENGSLTWNMHSRDGVPQGAAVLPTLPTYGQTYGRYSLRFRADPVAGYGLAFLLWPDSEKWPQDGEVDFPEGQLSRHIQAVAHHASPTGGTDPFVLPAGFDAWHVATIEWAPDQLRFLLDGAVVGTSTTRVPSRSMHWVLQTGSDGTDLPAPDARARIQIDWLEADARG